VDFTAISRMGDDVELVLESVVMGARSLTVQLGCMGPGGEARMRMRQVLVTTSLDTHQAIYIPQNVHAAVLAFWQH
jgi:4-hydroxybenzoyl-CoA thioesterase